MELEDKQIVSGKELVSYYKQHMWYYERLARLVSNFLEWRIIEAFRYNEHMPVLAKVKHREKQLESLVKNLQSGKRYENGVSLEQIGDLAGVRFVFYFNDDVRSFCREANQFQRYFGQNSQRFLEDKGGRAPTRNGSSESYRSWHLPVQVVKGTAFYDTLNEIDQKYLLGLRCEVQFRSILQDAWAETEHELKYKSQQLNLPAPTARLIKQNFLRLGEVLTKGDRLLTETKAHYSLSEPKERPSSADLPEPMLERNWSYEEPVYANACVIGDVRYGYELLDKPSQEQRVSSPPSVAPESVLFGVDRSMHHLGASLGFKQKVWNTLTSTDPQFISRINYDSSVVRVKGWDPNTRTLGVQVAAYSDQVVTNHKNALTQNVPGLEAKTIRDMAVDSERQLLPFETSPMSNTIGVSCVIHAEGSQWVIGLRSASVAYDPGSWGCSASGALNWIELGHWEDRSFHGWFTKGIMREMEEELGICPKQDEVFYLGFAREFGRAGKPQIFFLVESNKNCAEIGEIFHTYRRTDSEYQTIRFLTDAEARLLISDKHQSVNSICKDATVGEELRFNLALALDSPKRPTQ